MSFKKVDMMQCKTTYRWIGVSLIWVSVITTASNIDTAINKGEERAATEKQYQVKIDVLDETIRDVEREYRGVVKEVDGLEIYVQQLDKQLEDQRHEKEEVEKSIHQVALIERQITPLMLKMVDAISRFVEVDIPFQKEERMRRVKSLNDMMGRSDIEVAEKYRQVMQSYQDEMNYGRTIKTYRSTLTINSVEKEVDFLRVGRVALMYQTLDGDDSGVWDVESNNWKPLDSEYKSKLLTALRIAREQSAPDLIKVPVHAPILVAVEKK